MKVISFGGPVTVMPEAGGLRPSFTDINAVGVSDSTGYIPMDPPGVDIFEDETDAILNIEQAQREQLALQSEGLLTPAFGETVTDFIKRRSRELNEATRAAPTDEVC